MKENNIESKNEEYLRKLSKKREYWRTITLKGERTNYMVSNFGRITNKRTDKIYDFSNRKEGYYDISIRLSNTVVKTTVHRLVAMAFCKIPKRHRENGLTFKDLVPNHKDGIKHHNASFNLEWITQKENNDHAWKSGLCNTIRGENSHLSKMTEEQAIQICELIMEKKNNQEIHEIVGVSKKSIQHIRSGECWKHVVSRYNFPKLAEDKKYTIPTELIHEICKDIEKRTYSDYKIARRYNVKREYVRDIRTHKRRIEISKNYDF